MLIALTLGWGPSDVRYELLCSQCAESSEVILYLHVRDLSLAYMYTMQCPNRMYGNGLYCIPYGDFDGVAGIPFPDNFSGVDDMDYDGIRDDQVGGASLWTNRLYIHVVSPSPHHATVDSNHFRITALMSLMLTSWIPTGIQMETSVTIAGFFVTQTKLIWMGMELEMCVTWIKMEIVSHTPLYPYSMLLSSYPPTYRIFELV